MISSTIKKLSPILVILSLSGVLFGCASASKHEKTGSDRDPHGCIGSAGYSWSQVRVECIRIWEQGTVLEDSTLNIDWAKNYVVFSVDETKAELHLVGRKDHPILEKKGQFFEDATFRLEKKGDSWHLIHK